MFALGLASTLAALGFVSTYLGKAYGSIGSGLPIGGPAMPMPPFISICSTRDAHLQHVRPCPSARVAACGVLAACHANTDTHFDTCAPPVQL